MITLLLTVYAAGTHGFWIIVPAIRIAVALGLFCLALKLFKEEKKKQRELYKTAQMYEATFGISDNSIILADEHGNMIACSDMSARMLGYKDRHSVPRMRLEELTERAVISENLDDVIADIKSQLQKGCPYNGKLVFRLKDKSRVCMRTSIVPVYQEGCYLGLVAFLVNITEEYSYNEDLLEVVAMRDKILMDISHELRTPLNAIAGSVELLKLSKQMDEEAKLHVGHIKNGVYALRGIISSIEEYMQSRKSDIILELHPFTIHMIIDEIRNMIHIHAKEHGLKFYIYTAPDLPMEMRGDVRKITHVLVQLLKNAVDNTKEGEIMLSISKKIQDGKTLVRYEVRDTGVGITPEQMETLFDVTGRYKDLSVTKMGGMGLGLTICQEYIKAMGGKLICRSDYGKGSCFYFELETTVLNPKPMLKLDHAEGIRLLICIQLKLCDSHRLMENLREKLGLGACSWLEGQTKEEILEEGFTHFMIHAEDEREMEWLRLPMPGCSKILVFFKRKETREERALADRIIYGPITTGLLAEALKDTLTETHRGPGELFRTNHVRALVVDDNAVNLMVTSNILKEYGMEADEADSGTSAVQMSYNNDYDIIFMDFLMPEMDGAEAARQIRNIVKEGVNPVIIALTANISEEITKKFQEAGVNDVMQKPIDFDVLNQILRCWLPDEKIWGNREEAGSENMEHFQREAIENVLQTVEGLEWKEALETVHGNTDNYVRVLRAYCTNALELLNYIKAVDTALCSGDVCIYFHSLKGVFLNARVPGLADFSAKMEDACQKGDAAFIKNRKREYTEQVEIFISQLRRALDLYGDIKKATAGEKMEKEISAEDFNEKLKQVKKAVSRYEFNDINSLLNDLIAGSRGENRKHLKNAYNEAQEFCYEQVMEELEAVEIH